MKHWDLVANIYNTTFTLFFFLLAFLMFLIAYKGYKADNKYGGTSTTLSGIIFVIFGFYNSIFWFLPFPYVGFMVWWIGIILGILFTFALLIRAVSNKIIRDEEKGIQIDNPPALRRFVLDMRKESPYKDMISVKMEGVRKSFHLAGLLFLLSYFGIIIFGFELVPPVTEMVNNSVIEFIHEPSTQISYNILWGDPNGDYPYVKNQHQAVIDLTMFALIATLVLVIIADLIRVLWGAEYSVFNYVTRDVLRKKEFNAAGPQIYLVAGVIFAYLLFSMGFVSILTVLAGIMIACFSDALAALIGRNWGKHKVTCIGGDQKSIEGFIAGAGSAFLIGLFIVGPIYALIAALIFLLLDYFPVVIADNILNPIAITIGIGLAYYFFGFPMGWGWI